MADIHFDPPLTDKLVQAPATEWADLLAGGAPIGFGRDTDWSLLNQTLDAMRQAEPQPDFLLIPGDFLAHRLDSRFKAGGRTEAQYLDFAARTLQVVTQQIQQRFPGVPIFPVLGNNDDACGDYRADDGDATLTADLAAVEAMLGGPQSAAFETDWTRLGSYDLPLPGQPKIRVIGFDDTFFSSHYKACDGADDPNPDAALLAWLRDRLTAARAAGDRVWLMMHIPPGQDVYGTLKGAACPALPVGMWQDADLRAYIALIDEFADTIAAQFAGHTHMKEFRLIGAHGLVVGIPAVSPIYLQNPAFDLFTYGPDGAITDRVTTWFSNFSDVGQAPVPTPAWRSADFDAEWSVAAPDVDHLRSLSDRLTGTPAAGNADLARYVLGYGTGRGGVWELQHIDPAQAGRAIACSAANAERETFRRCFCPG